MSNKFPLLMLVLLMTIAGNFTTANTSASEPLPSGEGPWVVRAEFQDRQMVYDLAAWTEPWEVHYDSNYLIVDVDQEQYLRMLKAGFVLQIDPKLTAQLQQLGQRLPGQITGIPGYTCYRTVEETFATAQSIANDHPNLATWVDVGNSWEKETSGGAPGYDLMVLKLTNSAVSGPKPKLFIMTAVHAREYATAELNTRFAEYLVENYDSDPDVTWLLDYTEIHLLLQSNPDGRAMAETGLSWRKNTNENYCGPTSNNRGADLNRNFEFQWGCCGGSSGTPCDPTYRGPSPASEPETQAIQAYVRSQFPDQRPLDLVTSAPVTSTGVFLDIHSYGELVLWSWGFTATPAPNGTMLQTLGRKFAFSNHYHPEQAMSLYPTDGTTDDFAYGDLGIAAFTFELGTSFFQDCGTFENTILPDNLPALVYAAKAARTPYLTPAGPDALDLQLDVVGATQGSTVEMSATINDTRFNNTNGPEPTQNIAAAEYYIDVPPWITSTTPISHSLSAADGNLDSTIEVMTATIDTTGLNAGRHTIYVRGQDAAGSWGAVSAIFLHVLEPNVSPIIEGYVRDAGTNQALTAAVTAGAFHSDTDPVTGYYSMTVVSDTYDISAVAAGYAISSVIGIPAQDYQTVQQDFYLYPSCPVFTDDVESGNQGWTTSGNWAISTEASHSPTHAWSDSPGGNYGNYWNYTLTSPVIDLSSYQGTSLNFWHIYDLEPGWDYGYVEYSTNGGTDWTTIASFDGYNHSTWSREELSLPALDGQANARLRFRIDTDTNTVADGWHIDDIVVTAGGPPCASFSEPVPSFTSNSPVVLGQAIVFSNNTLGTPPISYHWEFGDEIGSSTQINPTYTYLSAGSFTVTLWATNTLGSGQVSQTVEVLPYQCVTVTAVTLNVDTAGAISQRQEVLFSADIEPNQASKPYSYTIDFDDGTLPITATSSADPLSMTHQFDAAGIFTPTLDVWNCNLLDPVSGRTVVTVEPLWELFLPLVRK